MIMSAAYWGQWSHAEIMSMHGVELDQCHDDQDDHVDYDANNAEEEQGCCAGCMACLGLSLRDFV